MVRSTTLALSIAALLGAAACNQQAPTVGSKQAALGVSVCLTLGTGCCDTDADCASGSSSCRTEKCDTTSHMCEVTSDTCQCGSGLGGVVSGLLGACDDKDLCTVDSCGSNGQCVHTPTALCCLTDANCDDGDSCTIDTCSIGLVGTAGQCTHTPVPDPLCCNTNDDCAGGLVGACGVATCQEDIVNPWPVCKAVSNLGVDCCNTVADCPQQACHSAACNSGKCEYTANTSAEACCATQADCPILNSCQIAVCDNAVCGVTVTVTIGNGCCNSAADCGGGDDCHAVSCSNNQCVTTNTCGQPDDCADGQCQRGPDHKADGGTTVPTATPTNDGGATYDLRGGGCNVAGTASSNGLALLVGAALFFVTRRRRA